VFKDFKDLSRSFSNDEVEIFGRKKQEILELLFPDAWSYSSKHQEIVAPSIRR
jgi:hypothetical protein